MEQSYSTPRRQARLELALPLRVRGRESHDHEWAELTRFSDVSQFGARFNLTRPTEPGRLLQLTSALPGQLRSFDLAAPQYRVWALVTNTKLTGEMVAEPLQMEIGVAFIGPRPPSGWEAAPQQLYEIAAPPVGAELWRVRESPFGGAKESLVRPETRHPIAVEVGLETFGGSGAEPLAEQTVTENLSRKGAAVFTTLDLAEGRFVRLHSEQPQVSLLAAVRLRRAGADGRIRLHLEFINGEWPFEGVETPD
jgi:hypothetical protein